MRERHALADLWELGSGSVCIVLLFPKKKFLHNFKGIVALVLCFARHPNAFYVVGVHSQCVAPSQLDDVPQCTSVHFGAKLEK